MARYSAQSLRSAGVTGSKSLPSSSLQGMRQRSTSFFCDWVRSLMREKQSSASLRFQFTRAYLPRWKRQLSTYLGPKSPQILGEQRMRWICSQLWKLRRMETCMTSMRGRNSFFTSSPIALADLNLCKVFKRVFFSLAAAELCTTFRSAAKKTRLVALTTVLSGLASHQRYSLSSYSTFTTPTNACMCFSNASDQRPPARSPAKSLLSSTTRANKPPTLGSQSANACELTATTQLFSGTLSQWGVKQRSLNSLAIRSPSCFWKAVCTVCRKVFAVRTGRYSCSSSINYKQYESELKDQMPFVWNDLFLWGGRLFQK